MLKTASLFYDPQVEEYSTNFLIRYRIDEDKFSQVLSSVASHSVLLLGMPAENSAAVSPTQPPFLIGIVHLAAPVNPEGTIAKLEGNYLLLSLAKMQPQKSSPVLS